MPVFPSLYEAEAYKAEQEANGLSCTILSSIEGYYVTCVFAISFEGIPKPEPPQNAVAAPTHIPLIPHSRVEIPDIVALRNYQKEAVDVALAHRHTLIVVPTGQGKSEIALTVVNALHENTIIIVPTIVLMKQWQSRIIRYGGSATTVSSEGVSFSPLTIITYASAITHISDILRYPVVILDEVHHAFSPEYRKILSALIEYGQHSKIIGLTASPRQYGYEKQIQDELFPDRYVRTIAESQRSEQHVEIRLDVIYVNLDDEERDRYDIAWKKYRNALREFGYDFGKMARAVDSTNPDTKATAYSGLNNYQEVKKLLSESPAKIRAVADVVNRNQGQFIVFADTIRTADVVYDMLKKYGVKVVELHSQMDLSDGRREMIVNMIRTGEARVIVGVTMLEEGIDLPDLNNAIFMSIVTRSDRRSIQRAGRILRPVSGKSAVLYVIVARGTLEEENLKRLREVLGFRKSSR